MLSRSRWASRASGICLVGSCALFAAWFASKDGPATPLEQVFDPGQPTILARSKDMKPIRFKVRNRSAEPIRLVGMENVCTALGCFGPDLEAFPMSIGPRSIAEISMLGRADQDGTIRPSVTFFSDVAGYPTLAVRVEIVVPPERP